MLLTNKLNEQTNINEDWKPTFVSPNNIRTYQIEFEIAQNKQNEDTHTYSNSHIYIRFHFLARSSSFLCKCHMKIGQGKDIIKMKSSDCLYNLVWESWKNCSKIQIKNQRMNFLFPIAATIIFIACVDDIKTMSKDKKLIQCQNSFLLLANCRSFNGEWTE